LYLIANKTKNYSVDKSLLNLLNLLNVTDCACILLQNSINYLLFKTTISFQCLEMVFLKEKLKE